MASMATPGAALAVIKRMFEDPIVRLLPSKTSVHQFVEGHNCHSYSPEKWADPLLLSKWKLGEEEDVARVMPVTEVQCYTQFSSIYARKYSPLGPKLDFSVFGQRLKALWKSWNQLDNLVESLEDIQNSPEFPIASILHNTMIFSNLRDEAAIVRLLMLQIMLSNPTDLTLASSLVHQVAVNMSVKEDKCTGSWSPPPETADYPQMGTRTFTSTLFVRAIGEVGIITLKDQFSNAISDESVVLIPVRKSWSGSSWLMAYILSFTSTYWWNHAYTLDVEYTNAVQEATEGLPMKATFMSKAATVRIPGQYTYICLVVIDAIRNEFPDDWQFQVCKGITASRDGNVEFAKKAYAYLGRLSDPEVVPMASDAPRHALNNMTYMFSSTELRQLQLKASILATSRFNGFGCYPNPKPPENRTHIFGPAAFNNKDDIQIGDYVLPDLAKMEEEERRTRLHVLNLWRSDPLGFFSYGSAILQNDTYSCASQYALSVSTNYMRILGACEVFLPPEPRCNVLGSSADILNTSLGYASLMLGLTNWYLVEMGRTLFDHNYISVDPELRNPFEFEGIWENITSDFVIEGLYGLSRSFTDDEKLRKLGWFMNISEQEDSVKTDWVDNHFSGNVPWWFVGAIAAKFGQSFQVKSPRCEFKNENGWLIGGKNSEQYDLSLLTASNQYEQKVQIGHEPYFKILTPNLKRSGNTPNVALKRPGMPATLMITRSGMTHNMISWDMNSLLDKKKSKWGSSLRTEDFDGIVELNVLIFPTNLYPNSFQAFVASNNRISAENPTSWPQVSGLGLKGKDCLDWLGAVPE